MSESIQLTLDFTASQDSAEVGQSQTTKQSYKANFPGEASENHSALEDFSDETDQFLEDQHRVFTVSPGARPMGRDSDTRERIAEILKRLRNSGNFRPVRVPDETVDEQLKTLAEEFPNFSHVVQSIVAVHAKMLRRGVRHRMPHILLTGEPGVGKTKFASELARLLKAPLLKVDMSVETNGSALGGSSTFWSNSAVGSLFSMLAFGHGGQAAAANSICFVDEVDKAGRSLTHDPLAPLYTLLEPSSATKFADQGLPGVSIDTSLVRWILTSNSIASIPEPILSRLTVFNIQAPTKEQSRRIARKIALDCVCDYDLDINPCLSRSILDDCAELTPREIRKRLELALGIAVVSDASSLTTKAWRASAIADVSDQKSLRRMGFL